MHRLLTHFSSVMLGLLFAAPAFAEARFLTSTNPLQ